ncbi:hypothetical protein V8C35DRAFT_331751 [Trichoderma chlorosporum]
MATLATGEASGQDKSRDTDADGDAAMDAETGADRDTILDVRAKTGANINTDINPSIPAPPPFPSPVVKYPDLMKEIWKRVCTAPSSRSGVQIFSLEKKTYCPKNPFLPRWMPLGPPRVAPRDGGYGWYFRNAAMVRPSFEDHNPSTYLVDYGLWNACKQSRAVMLEAYQFGWWYTIVPRISVEIMTPLSRQGLIEMPVLVKFRHGGKNHWLSFFPNKDLIYLQPEELETASWDWGMCLGTDTIRWSLDHMPNIALERNARRFWVKYFARLATKVSPNTTIWFVDERFKRKAIAHTQEQMALEIKRRYFYGSDRQYVEVMGHAFPLDHEQWLLLSEEMDRPKTPPPVDPYAPSRHDLWGWPEDPEKEQDKIIWSGEWFIHTIQYYIKAKAVEQAAARAREEEEILARGRRMFDGEKRDKSQKHRKISCAEFHSSKDHEVDPHEYDFTHATRFGLLACEFF